MKNTYFITDGQIEVDIGADYLLIKDHSREADSKYLFRKKRYSFHFMKLRFIVRNSAKTRMCLIV